MNAYEALAQVQSKLKAPKNQRNTFGGYNYRSAEDILEAVKPLAYEVGCAVNCTDEVLMIGDRYYVVATAIFATPAGQLISTRGWAREQDERKGMDASQVTGSASSYARKYALNGLFAIDDTKDADAQGDEKPAKATKGRRSKKGTAEKETAPQTAPDALSEAKQELFYECKMYAARYGLDADAIAKGVMQRDDYNDNKDSAEWYLRIAEEYRNE